MPGPIISVITVALNAKDGLERTMQSVCNQTGINYEHIIVDGGSTDGSVEILRQQKDARVVWHSEKDSGIYDAMNKGIDQARGKWLYFLGAGDTLIDGVLAQIVPHLNEKLAVLIGNIRHSDGKVFTGTFSDQIFISNTVHHQGAFYNRHVFDRFRYDTTLRALSDYELNLTLYLKKKRYEIVDIDICICELDGISSQLYRSLIESNHIKYKYLSFWRASYFGAVLGWKYLLIYLRQLKKTWQMAREDAKPQIL
jgi:putative colanic acid biosynthesis glycosyltransferase